MRRWSSRTRRRGSRRLIASYPEVAIFARRVAAAFIVPVVAVPTAVTVIFADVVANECIAYADQNVGQKCVVAGKCNGRNGTDC